jgi:hypothetical protein
LVLLPMGEITAPISRLPRLGFIDAVY